MPHEEAGRGHRARFRLFGCHTERWGSAQFSEDAMADRRRRGQAVPPCVDGPWNARLLYRWDRSGSVMCPAFYRGIVATGPDEVRGWRANQFVELKALGEPRLCSIPGPTGSPSLLSPSFLRSTIAEPDSSNGCVPVSLLSSQKSPRDAGGLVCDRYRHHACRFALQELRDPLE